MRRFRGALRSASSVPRRRPMTAPPSSSHGAPRRRRRCAWPNARASTPASRSGPRAATARTTSSPGAPPSAVSRIPRSRSVRPPRPSPRLRRLFSLGFCAKGRSVVLDILRGLGRLGWGCGCARGGGCRVSISRIFVPTVPEILVIRSRRAILPVGYVCFGWSTAHGMWSVNLRLSRMLGWLGCRTRGRRVGFVTCVRLATQWRCRFRGCG